MRLFHQIRKYFGLLSPYLGKIVRTLEDWFHYAVWACILFLMVLITIGVFLRYAFNRPILGQVDISELIIGVIVFFGISYTQRTGGHAQVEIVINRLKGKVYHFVASLTLLLPFVVFLIVTISSFEKALFLKEIGDATPTIHIPVWPFRMTIPVGCGLLCARFAIQIFQHLAQVKSGDERTD